MNVEFSTKKNIRKNTHNGLKSILRQTYFFSIFRGGGQALSGIFHFFIFETFPYLPLNFFSAFLLFSCCCPTLRSSYWILFVLRFLTGFGLCLNSRYFPLAWWAVGNRRFLGESTPSLKLVFFLPIGKRK